LRKRIVDIDWSPYLVKIEHLSRLATNSLNNKDYGTAHHALMEIERNAFNCRHWLKENIDGKAA
jgi:hypothetical protein